MKTSLHFENLAEVLYTQYCHDVGGKAFNGDPLPSWPVFSADEKKQVQVAAWRRVAHNAYDFILTPQPA